MEQQNFHKLNFQIAFATHLNENFDAPMLTFYLSSQTVFFGREFTSFIHCAPLRFLRLKWHAKTFIRHYAVECYLLEFHRLSVRKFRMPGPNCFRIICISVRNLGADDVHRAYAAVRCGCIRVSRIIEIRTRRALAAQNMCRKNALKSAFSIFFF